MHELSASRRKQHNREALQLSNLGSTIFSASQTIASSSKLPISPSTTRQLSGSSQTLKAATRSPHQGKSSVRQVEETATLVVSPAKKVTRPKAVPTAREQAAQVINKQSKLKDLSKSSSKTIPLSGLPSPSPTPEEPYVEILALDDEQLTESNSIRAKPTSRESAKLQPASRSSQTSKRKRATEKTTSQSFKSPIQNGTGEREPIITEPDIEGTLTQDEDQEGLASKRPRKANQAKNAKSSISRAKHKATDQELQIRGDDMFSSLDTSIVARTAPAKEKTVKTIDKKGKKKDEKMPIEAIKQDGPKKQPDPQKSKAQSREPVIAKKATLGRRKGKAKAIVEDSDAGTADDTLGQDQTETSISNVKSTVPSLKSKSEKSPSKKAKPLSKDAKSSQANTVPSKSENKKRKSDEMEADFTYDALVKLIKGNFQAAT